jgi:hypothetical protein
MSSGRRQPSYRPALPSGCVARPPGYRPDARVQVLLALLDFGQDRVGNVLLTLARSQGLAHDAPADGDFLALPLVPCGHAADRRRDFAADGIGILDSQFSCHVTDLSLSGFHL